MGNLLRIVMGSGDESPTRTDIFVDFESMQSYIWHCKGIVHLSQKSKYD